MSDLSEFEVRYNAVEGAQLLMTARLVLEVARLHGAQGAEWIDRFRNATVTELNDAKDSEGNPRDPRISAVSQSVVVNVAKMAKDRFSQLKDEGLL